jgi:hypothetical protein
MAFTGTTFADVDAALVDVSARIAKSNRAVFSAITAFSSQVTALDAIANDYSGIITVAQGLLDTDPTDEALINMRKKIDLLLADRATAKTRAQALEAAVSGI